MPILGSSTISGFGATGPTGDAGPAGPTGPSGNAGITKGNTGSTADYIKYVISDKTQNQITFKTAEEQQFILNGFTGPTGYVYNISGVSSSISSSLVSGLSKGSGFTFSFFGITAGSAIGLTTNSNTITVNYIPARDPYTKTPQQNYIPYIEMTSIGGGPTGIIATKIYSDTNNNLQFGLTTSPEGITFNYLYTNLNEEIYTITSGGVRSQGGITLDLTLGYSNYWIPDNSGITAFVVNNASQVRQEYTLFFAGSNIWNLPKNLYLQNAAGGLSYGGFVKGLNILHIWSDNAGATFNGIFLERGVGQNSPYSH